MEIYSIDDFIKKEGINQTQLAKRLGVNKNSITRAIRVGWLILETDYSVKLVSPKAYYEVNCG